MTESIGTVTLETAEGQEELRIVLGWMDEQKNQIVELTARDSLVCSLTGDSDRFADLDTLNRWLAKRAKTLFAVLDESDVVVGTAWIAEMPCENTEVPEEFGFTFAIRLYEKARGAGLAVPVLVKVFEYFMQTPMYKNGLHRGFWLHTKIGNIPAKRTYAKFGFTTIAQNDEYIWMTWMPDAN